LPFFHFSPLAVWYLGIQNSDHHGASGGAIREQKLDTTGRATDRDSASPWLGNYFDSNQSLSSEL
jgi:hypothetical protein